MEIRKIKDNDDERTAYILLTRYAFVDWAEEEVDALSLTWARPENVWGVFVDGDMASGLMCFPADQNVRGTVRSMGAVSAVATAPLYRGRGYIRELIRAAFEEMRRRGTAVSMLRPFRESFYRRFGYVSANSSLMVKFPMESLRRWLAYEPPPGWEVTTAPSSRAVEHVMEYWREKALPRYHGVIYPLEPTPDEWRRRFKDQVACFATCKGDRRGLTLFKKTGFAGEGKLDVTQFLWEDADARDLLLQLLARHRDQVSEVKVRLPYGTPFQQWIEDVLRPLRINASGSPWMVRVMDVAAALDGLPAAAAGELAVELTDEQCEWNNGPYTLRAEDGRLRVAKGGVGGDLRMDIKGLSALTYGTLPPAELERRGWLSGGDAASRELLAAWFPCEFLFNSIDF